MQHKPSSVEAWLAELGNPSADRDYLDLPLHEAVRRLRILARMRQGEAARLRGGTVRTRA